MYPLKVYGVASLFFGWVSVSACIEYRLYIHII